MENKENFCNLFKFGIYLGNEPISERVFSGDDFNQVTMYQIDIRRIIGSIQRRVQTVLSSTNLTYNVNGYNTLEYFKKMNKDYGYSILDTPEEKTVTINKKVYNKEDNKSTIEEKIYKGVEVKIGFYLNDKTIFERNVYVNRFNPKSRFSNEMYEVVYEIVDEIRDKIKNDDNNQMWEDFDLINNYNLHISQVRELSKEERSKLLYRAYKK